MRYDRGTPKEGKDMNWITGIQRAIDYIEDHLDEEIDYGEIAKRAYSSPFHFQRIFSALCGLTLGEYIRQRRLTLAGAELAAGGVKVIDVAMKYGYDTPESFSRAFCKFHGFPPSRAKKENAVLRSFSRLSVNLSLTGGSQMDYRIETKNSFPVLEKRENMNADDSVNRLEIPAFWTRSRADGTIETLARLSPSKRIMGVCYGNVPKDAKQFVYSIAAEYDGISEIPEGLVKTEIPSQTWAVFRCKGAMPDAMQKTWHRIYAEFFPSSPYRPVCGADIEVYPSGDMDSPDYESEIWIAVRSV